MDKYEFNIKVEQIKKLVGKGDYETAMKIADAIDWRRVRNANLLSMVASVYEKNQDYQEAREILLLAFERAPIGKRLLYKLAELALLEGNIEEAEAYYREFGELAGEDPRQQLLRYMILKAKGAPAQQLIHSLESYTNQEIDEKWLYELAELYSLAGMADRCVQTCDRIMLMFGLGKYVEKAMELKVQYAPLTSYQMDLVENRDKYEAKLRAVEEKYNLGSNMDGFDQEYYDDEEPEMDSEEPYYEDLNACMEEAQVQEGLAREMSQISNGEPSYEPSNPSSHDPSYGDFGNTREFGDVGNGGHSSGQGAGYAVRAAKEAAAAGAGLAGMGMAGAVPRPRGRGRWQEPADEPYGEPVIEEDCGFGNEYEPYLEEEGQPEYGEPGYEEPEYEEPQYNKDGYEQAKEDPDACRQSSEQEEAENSLAGVAELASESGAKAESDGDEAESDGDEAESYRDKKVPDGDEAELHRDKKVSYGDRAAPKDSGSRRGAVAPRISEKDDLEMVNLMEEPEERVPFNHLMIEARTPEKGLQIAIQALKQIHKETGSKNPVAKITGAKLSRLGVLSSTEKLSGRDLVVEEAGDLTTDALDELNELLERDSSGIIVVLIDNPKQMEGLHRNHPLLAGKFECIGGDEIREEKDASSQIAPQASDRPSERNKTLSHGAAQPASTRRKTFEDSSRRPYGQGEHAYGSGHYGSEHYGSPSFGSMPNTASSELEPYETTSYESEPYETASYGSEPYETASYESRHYDGADDGEQITNQRKGLFGSRKKRVYKELPPEEPYEDEDYYVENEEEPQLARDQEGPGSHGEEMGIDEFAQYACRYANDIDCSITGKSMLALYERIEIMEEDGVPLTRVNAENIIEEAADRAEKPSIGKRVKGLFTNKYDKDGFLVLKEEHFIY